MIVKNKQKPIVQELRTFLNSFSPDIEQPIQQAETAEWNEISVPSFRNFKVFVHEITGVIIFILPTHISGTGDVAYHVITEDMNNDVHNGKYEIISRDDFKSRYKCNFIAQQSGQSKPTKITDMADVLFNKLNEIKNLKNETAADKKTSTEYFGKLIMEFLIKNMG